MEKKEREREMKERERKRERSRKREMMKEGAEALTIDGRNICSFI
jgi:hypothetical protein